MGMYVDLMVEETQFDQAKFIDVGSLNRDSALNTAAQGVTKGSNNLVSQLKNGLKGGHFKAEEHYSHTPHG